MLGQYVNGQRMALSHTSSSATVLLMGSVSEKDLDRNNWRGVERQGCVDLSFGRHVIAVVIRSLW